MSIEDIKIEKTKLIMSNFLKFAGQKGLNQKELGRLCGIDTSDISAFKNGRKSMSTNTFAVLVDKLGISVREALNIDGICRTSKHQDEKETADKFIDLHDQYSKLRVKFDELSDKYIGSLENIMQKDKEIADYKIKNFELRSKLDSITSQNQREKQLSS